MSGENTVEDGAEYCAAILDALKSQDPALGRKFLLEQAGRDPVEVLVLTILSQATNDRNSGLAYRELRARFPSWDQVLRAPDADVEAAIRRGGLARMKASRIKAALRRIRRETGSVSLDFLSGWETEDILRYLCSFDGIGPKTAACVALFALGRPVFPVDTHILRVCRRLGLVDEKATAARAQDQLQRKIPPGMRRELHLGLIEHGRRTCRPGNPRCHSCSLRAFCRKPGLKDFSPPAEKS
ncbi:MAG: endonuclease III [Firmicutes bacterium]|nr:endonuclease III [Bacillota bacterium]